MSKVAWIAGRVTLICAVARGLAAFALVQAVPSCVAVASVVSDVVLRLPRPLRAGEGASLTVMVGVLRRGQQLQVTTDGGLLIGTIAPYGVPPGREAGAYVLPVPAAALHGDTLSVRLRVTRGDGPARAPTEREVQGITLSITPTSL